MLELQDPYHIIRTIGTHIYELDIPATIQKYRIFPVSLLHPATKDPLPGQIIQPPLPVVVEGEEEWEVEGILDSQRGRERLQYWVKWRGFTDPMWEPEENLTEMEADDIYHGRYPECPSPVRAAFVGTRVQEWDHSRSVRQLSPEGQFGTFRNVEGRNGECSSAEGRNRECGRMEWDVIAGRWISL